jgi:hypothetical protein
MKIISNYFTQKITQKLAYFIAFALLNLSMPYTMASEPAADNASTEWVKVEKSQKEELYTVGIGAGVGSLGGQYAITLPITSGRSLVFRLVSNDLKYFGLQDKLMENLDNKDVDGQEYKVDLKWQTHGIIFDWHPFTDGFAFSAGLLKNNIAITGSTHFNQGADLGGLPVDVAGDVNATMSFTKEYAPYYGIRFGNALASG